MTQGSNHIHHAALITMFDPNEYWYDLDFDPRPHGVVAWEESQSDPWAVVMWCRQNICNGDWDWRTRLSVDRPLPYYQFAFRKAEDMALFKMSWS